MKVAIVKLALVSASKASTHNARHENQLYKLAESGLEAEELLALAWSTYTSPSNSAPNIFSPRSIHPTYLTY